MRDRRRWRRAVRHGLTASILGAALAVAGCSTSGSPEPVDTPAPTIQSPTVSEEPAAKTNAAPGSRCGSVTFPSGSPGTVVVHSGQITCTDAVALINRYFNDPSITRQGNTLSAMFDGWTCVSPTAAAADLAGYGSKCEKGAVVLTVVTG